jgi:hypothetical protein
MLLANALGQLGFRGSHLALVVVDVAKAGDLLLPVPEFGDDVHRVR